MASASNVLNEITAKKRSRTKIKEISNLNKSVIIEGKVIEEHFSVPFRLKLDLSEAFYFSMIFFSGI